MSIEEKPSQKTEPVSIYAGNRAVIRAIAGAAATSPAVIVERALRAYLETRPDLRAVADAALAVTARSATRAVDEVAHGNSDAIGRGSP